MSQSPASKATGWLNSVRSSTAAERRAAAVVCASYALGQPDPETTLHELLDALGLYPTTDTP